MGSKLFTCAVGGCIYFLIVYIVLNLCLATLNTIASPRRGRRRGGNVRRIRRP